MQPLKKAEVPKDWKTMKEIAMYKRETPNDVANYQPVFLTSIYTSKSWKNNPLSVMSRKT